MHATSLNFVASTYAFLCGNTEQLQYKEAFLHDLCLICVAFQLPPIYLLEL